MSELRDRNVVPSSDVEDVKVGDSAEFTELRQVFHDGFVNYPDLGMIPVPADGSKVTPVGSYRKRVCRLFKLAGLWDNYKRFRKKMLIDYGLHNSQAYFIADGFFLCHIRNAVLANRPVREVVDEAEVLSPEAKNRRDRVLDVASKRRPADEKTRLEWVFRHMPGPGEDINWPSLVLTEVPDSGSVRLLEWASVNPDKFYTAYHAPHSRKMAGGDLQTEDRSVAETTERLSELLEGINR
jgi:hypothetical protein